jgi:hypothetical protein
MLQQGPAARERWSVALATASGPSNQSQIAGAACQRKRVDRAKCDASTGCREAAMSREQQKGPARGAGRDMGQDRAQGPPRGVRARKAWRRGACRPESIFFAMMPLGEGAAKAVESLQPVGVVCSICQSEGDVIVCDPVRLCYIRYLIC